MYIPEEDWPGYLDAVLNSFSSDGVRCASEYCFFGRPCDQVDGGALAAKKLKVIVFYEGMPE